MADLNYYKLKNIKLSSIPFINRNYNLKFKKVRGDTLFKFSYDLCFDLIWINRALLNKSPKILKIEKKKFFQKKMNRDEWFIN